MNEIYMRKHTHTHIHIYIIYKESNKRFSQINLYDKGVEISEKGKTGVQSIRGGRSLFAKQY